MTPLLQKEILRKSLHFLIGFSPLLGSINRLGAIALLAFGVVLYTIMEILRLKGVSVPLVSFITERAMRERDRGFVKGPVTLGMGALLSMTLFPPPVAAIAIYALAFGDGLSSLAGRLFGRLRPWFLFGKSVEGSIVCFAAVFSAAFLASRSVRASLCAAAAATVAEALPLKDWDNIIIPLATGAVLFCGGYGAAYGFPGSCRWL
ncbi:MAG: phosphatidate cytidylyltransferase [Treponema sp.]|jgi:dolichol kinase|nr:phosphatidate cytidylyltransferase [Treponema sp.]